MIFKQVQQVLDGTKTQTRRPVKPTDVAKVDPKDWLHGLGEPMTIFWKPDCGYPIHSVYRWDNWLKWQVGRTYAVQPGRGKKAVGRIRITKIRRERLQEITPEDVIAEGFYVWGDEQYEGDGVWKYHRTANVPALTDVWDASYRKPNRWDDNPDVWVLDFELVEGRAGG